MDLADLVRDAFDFLKPEFGADNVPPPGVAVDQAPEFGPGCYDPVVNLIFLQSEVLPNDFLTLRYIIGEEVSHYIHHQVNPQLVKMQLALKQQRKTAPAGEEKAGILTDDISIANCIECIGAYGGLLYLQKGAGKEKTRDFAFDAFRRTVKQLPRLDKPEDEESFQVAKHGFGYMAAIDAYTRHGNRYLKAAARVDAIEAVRVLVSSPREFFAALGQ
jgi:hypothetical protein